MGPRAADLARNLALVRALDKEHPCAIRRGFHGDCNGRRCSGFPLSSMYANVILGRSGS